MVGERLRKGEKKLNRIRNAPGSQLEKKIPRVEGMNIGRGTAVGVVQAAIAVILDDTVGVPFGASSEILDTENTNGGTLYTVNVNAPTANMAQARAFLESTTGFASILTDNIDVRGVDVVSIRPLRDTYEVKVKVSD